MAQARLLASNVPVTELFGDLVADQLPEEVGNILSEASQAIDQLNSPTARLAYAADAYKLVRSAAGWSRSLLQQQAKKLICDMVPLMLIKALMRLSGQGARRKAMREANELMFGAESFDKFLQKAYDRLQPAAGAAAQQKAIHAGAGSNRSSSNIRHTSISDGGHGATACATTVSCIGSRILMALRGCSMRNSNVLSSCLVVMLPESASSLAAMHASTHCHSCTLRCRPSLVQVTHQPTSRST
jgi:hypothetical protein